MGVRVSYNGKEYVYSEKSGINIWMDERGLPIPTFLHTVLREKALATGVSKEVFLTKGRITVPTSSEKKKTVKVSKKVRGFNPFK